MAVEPITIADLTEVKLDGKGALDQLLQVTRLHLAKEHDAGRLKGQEYAAVLTGGITAVLQNAVMFLLQKDEAANKAALVEAQIKLTEKQGELLDKQIAQADKDAELIAAKVKLTLEQAKLPDSQIKSAGFQDLLVQEQTKVQTAQARRIDQEILSAGFQDLLVKEQTAKTKQDVLTAVQQTKVMEQQVLESTQKVANMKQELLNLVAQECLLKAQFDLTKDQGLNTQEQTILVRQKVASERAQTIGAGVDADSVIGRQKELYKAQADGFKRDAEQKAAKILIDTWNVRRTTDTGTQANTTNRLDDANVGRVVNMLMTGVGA
ncbi:hypothetical protein [Pseudomonas phage L15]|nr:hypothetical protein [Pseudomonas phage vB_Pae-PA14]WJZ49006.1 hypothetical protein [Pseudomonas phage PA15]WNV49543.1 hypothetical protein [Pseudomonas phage L15]